jgi:hypothetical protein
MALPGDPPPKKPRKAQARPLSDKVTALLAEHPDWSQAEVAAAAGASVPLVGKVRRELRERSA